MDPILIPMMALLIPIVVVPTSLWFRHRMKVQQLEHAERIRAMELGLQPRQHAMGWPGAVVCLGIGAGVPIGSMLVALLAVVAADAPNEVFGIPLLISFGAIWAAKALAERMLGADGAAGDQAPSRVRAGHAAGKPAFDPDAYDVAGSRG